MFEYIDDGGQVIVHGIHVIHGVQVPEVDE